MENFENKEVKKKRKFDNFKNNNSNSNENDKKNKKIKKEDKEDDIFYQFGNYPSYYTKRNFNEEEERINIFIKNENLFENKNKLLDVGCNNGDFTIKIGKLFYKNIKKSKRIKKMYFIRYRY
jgi:hypothetical protein